MSLKSVSVQAAQELLAHGALLLISAPPTNTPASTSRRHAICRWKSWRTAWSLFIAARATAPGSMPWKRRATATIGS